MLDVGKGDESWSALDLGGDADSLQTVENGTGDHGVLALILVAADQARAEPRVVPGVASPGGGASQCFGVQFSPAKAGQSFGCGPQKDG